MSDILEGITKGQIAGRQLGTYGHIIEGQPNYWELSEVLEIETVAHLFEALGSQGERLEVMKTIFSQTWNSFINYMGDF